MSKAPRFTPGGFSRALVKAPRFTPGGFSHGKGTYPMGLIGKALGAPIWRKLEVSYNGST